MVKKGFNLDQKQINILNNLRALEVLFNLKVSCATDSNDLPLIAKAVVYRKGNIEHFFISSLIGKFKSLVGDNPEEERKRKIIAETLVNCYSKSDPRPKDADEFDKLISTLKYISPRELLSFYDNRPTKLLPHRCFHYLLTNRVLKTCDHALIAKMYLKHAHLGDNINRLLLATSVLENIDKLEPSLVKLLLNDTDKNDSINKKIVETPALLAKTKPPADVPAPKPSVASRHGLGQGRK